MSRVLHLGILPESPGVTCVDLAEALRANLPSEFHVMGSFTDWGEPLDPDEHDAVHVVVNMDQDHPISAGAALAIVNQLQGLLALSRLVDFWVDSDEVWGEDTHIHGRFALRSVSGHRL